VNAARSVDQVALAIALATTLLAGCGKKEEPKVDSATEQREAMDRARKGPYGSQIQSLDKAKALEADVNKKASEQVDNIEKDAK
jgi:outer membrane murein-binding lipoprotein Lpp